LTITLSWRIVGLGGKVHNDFQLRIRHERTMARLQSYGGSKSISETPLGRVIQWKPTGSIAHKHRNGAITELVAVGVAACSRLCFITANISTTLPRRSGVGG